MKQPPSNWYKNIWTLDIKEQSWVEETAKQVDFLVRELNLTGRERILDLACGFGRHSLELARRGYAVVGVDITPAYIEDARATARQEGLNAEFLCADLRDLTYDGEFDVVLNLADGAIGYLEDDEENGKLFHVIARALKPGGTSVMDICSREHAELHFPKKHWEIGSRQISLPVFDYEPQTRRMLFGGFDLVIGEVCLPPQSVEACSSTRLYSYDEVRELFAPLGVKTLRGYGDYDETVPLDHRHLQMVILSRKTCAGC
jgi:SAM-dependent methyltransferase